MIILYCLYLYILFFFIILVFLTYLTICLILFYLLVKNMMSCDEILVDEDVFGTKVGIFIQSFLLDYDELLSYFIFIK